MNEDIYHLTFVTSVRGDAPVPNGAEALNRAFDCARAFDILGISGLVLQRGRRSLWSMEGAEAVVAAQYERLKARPDVEGVTVLRQRHAERCSFSRWGFAIEDDPRENQPPAPIDRLILLLSHAPPEIRQTFLAFAKLDAPARMH